MTCPLNPRDVRSHCAPTVNAPGTQLLGITVQVDKWVQYVLPGLPDFDDSAILQLLGVSAGPSPRTSPARAHAYRLRRCR
jgi:hypothetical protein